MPQKFKTFIERNWLAVITLVWLAISSYFSIAGATEDHSREIGELRQSFSNLNVQGSLPLRELRRDVQVLTNEAVALKDFTFRIDRRLNRFERNQDRITWVVEEIARRNGIIPPKTIPEPPYE